MSLVLKIQSMETTFSLQLVSHYLTDHNLFNYSVYNMFPLMSSMIAAWVDL